MKKEKYVCPEIEEIKKITEDFIEKADAFITRQKEFNKKLNKTKGE